MFASYLNFVELNGAGCREVVDAEREELVGELRSEGGLWMSYLTQIRAAGITRFWWQRIRLRILVVVNQMIQAHYRQMQVRQWGFQTVRTPTGDIHLVPHK